MLRCTSPTVHPLVRAVCIHCGTAFQPTEHRPGFCCAGCEFVHGLIAQRGLGQFYDLQEAGAPPVKSLVFQKRDWSWLEELIVHAERMPVAHLVLGIQGLSCIACVWLIERLFAQKPGGLEIRVDPAPGRLELRWTPGVFDALAFARELQGFGYLVGPPDTRDSSASRSLVIRLGLCAALMMNTMLFTLPGYLGMAEESGYAPLFRKCTLILGTLSLLIGGSYFFVRSWRSLRRGILHIDLPISLGLLATYAGSVYAWVKGAHRFTYFDFVATFTFLMLVGRWLQQKAVERNRAQLLAGQNEPPPVLDSTTGARLSAAKITPGAVFTVAPGQLVPVRARLASRAATLNLEWISGESDAALIPRGRLVPSGASNCGESAIELEALEPWRDSLLARLLQAAPAHSPRDLRLERFPRRYLLVVLSLAAIAFASWWGATRDLLAALQVVISVLVVSCPCASGVALPLCSDLAASRLRRLGVFIRDGALWGKLDRIRKIVFDKTGTLTLEGISLRNPEVLRQLTPAECGILLAMVQDSFHPVSGCLREQLLAAGVSGTAAGPVHEVVGFGLELEHGGARYRLGRPGWAASGGTGGDCLFTRDGAVLTRFAFGEEARGDAAEEIGALRRRGCEVYILSGDRHAKVAAMADRLALPRASCLGELSPQQKADWMTHHDDRDTLYLGDGANDSFAFDAAWCTGTPAIDRGLLEQKADFYFLGRGLAGVCLLLDTAQTRRRTAHRVVAFAIAYNAVAVAICLAGRMNPLLAAVLMPASSLISLGIVFLGLRANAPFDCLRFVEARTIEGEKASSAAAIMIAGKPSMTSSRRST